MPCMQTGSTRTMAERWAVAFAVRDRMRTERFLWGRNKRGEIEVFPSKWAARSWVATNARYPGKPNEAVYIKLSPGTDDR